MRNSTKNREFRAACNEWTPFPTEKTFSFFSGKEDFLSREGNVSFHKSTVYAPVKRILDVLLSAVLLFLLAFPMFFIAVCIRCDSSGPAIFRQTRVGRDLQPFTVYKFRTMKLNAPECSSLELSKIGREHYLTQIGRLLRRTGIDELPQLWNVLRGEMSLVGPRPVIPKEVYLTELRASLGVVGLRPGITGLAQIKGRDDRTAEEKAVLDAIYARTLSPLNDFKILYKTALAVFLGTGCN